MQDIRAQLAIEFIQDLQGVRQENSELLRETLTASFAFSDDALAAAGSSSEDESGGSGGDGTAGGGSGAGGFMHPELAEALAEQRAAAAIKAALEPNDKTKKPRGPNEP